MLCSHCPGELTEHDGLRHCAACGCYFTHAGTLDPFHTACRDATEEDRAGMVRPEPERRTRRAAPAGAARSTSTAAPPADNTEGDGNG